MFGVRALAGSRRGVLLALLTCCAVAVVPTAAVPELRPLVREMLENLASLDDIGKGLALDDYELVSSSAEDLVARAQSLKQAEPALLGIEPGQKPQWDAYLAAQVEAATSVVAAAGREDAGGVLLGTQQVVQSACLPCHAQFREPLDRLAPSVLFMTSFLSAWQDMNRGLAVNDYVLIARRARELEAMGRVLSWDRVIQNTFGLEDAKERQVFRRLIQLMIASAARIETAALEENASAVVETSTLMWSDACIACHARFRDGEPAAQ